MIKQGNKDFISYKMIQSELNSHMTQSLMHFIYFKLHFNKNCKKV